MSEENAAKKMGYRVKEKTKSPGYKQIKNLIKSIASKARKLLEDDDERHQDAHEHEKVYANDETAGALSVLGFDQLFPPFVHLHSSCSAVIFDGI